MRRAGWRWAGAGVAALAAALGGAGIGAAQAPALRAAVVGRVEDGRTLWLEGGGGAPVRARLAWVAPPAGGRGGEAAGAAARRHLERWKGERVEFLEVGRDPDGVPAVEVLWRPAGESVVALNYEMVRSGFARADCSLAGAYALQCRVLRRAEEVARREGRGLWAPRP